MDVHARPRPCVHGGQGPHKAQNWIWTFGRGARVQCPSPSNLVISMFLDVCVLDELHMTANNNAGGHVGLQSLGHGLACPLA